jgi:hypothetical protein
MITESQLRSLMQNEEGQHLEFKQSLCDWREIGEYAVGIGNEGGGWLFMGITNKKPRGIAGIKVPSQEDLQQIQRSVWDSMNIRIETQLIAVAEGTVLGIKIPSRLPGQLFCTKDGRFLMRVGEDLRGMSQIEVAAVLKESATPVPSSTVAELKALPKSQQLRVTPQMPREHEARSLTLLEVDDRTVTVTTQGHQILIPISAVTGTQWRGAELTLKLNGRLQWITGEERWQFLDDPLSESHRELGLPKGASLQKDPRAQAIQDKLSPKGYQFYWTTLRNLAKHTTAGWQIVYDYDGCYFNAGEHVLICKPPGIS